MIVPSELPSSTDVAEHYDELDWVYREIWGEHVHHGLWLTGVETPETAVPVGALRSLKRACGETWKPGRVRSVRRRW